MDINLVVVVAFCGSYAGDQLWYFLGRKHGRKLLARKPRTLKFAALLDKPSRRQMPVEADYVGFKIPDEFVVGYGLDYAERFRNLPDICIFSEDTAE